MSFAAPRKGSEKSALRSTPQTSRASSRTSTRLQSSASASGLRAGQAGSTKPPVPVEIWRRRSLSSAASSRLCTSSKMSQGRYSGGNNTSTAFTSSLLGDKKNSTPRSCISKNANSLHGKDACSNERSDQNLKENMRSLLFGKGRLSDIRPDLYRLDLTQKKDIQFLYETQHRVDPELVPVRRRATHDVCRRMQHSKIFDTAPSSCRPATVTVPRKRDDGLGMLARFILCAEERSVTPMRGRRHCANSPLRGNASFLCGGNGSACETPRSQPRACGKRRVPTQPTEKLGMDLLSLEVPGASRSPIRGVRSLKAVQMFEATQPKLTLPPQKGPRRGTGGTRCHSASSDNDIFGVRGRREKMMQRCRSASARSNDPYGLSEGDEVAQQERSQLGTFVGPFSTEMRANNTPFGDNESLNVCTPTRNQHGRGGSSFGGNSRRRSASHSLSLLKCLDPSSTSVRSRSEAGGLKTEAAKREPVNVEDDVTQTNTASLISDENQNIKNSLFSPRIRTGKAMVPGRSLKKSNIIFGDAHVVTSSNGVLRQTQFKSSKMYDILSWGAFS